jgi:hypothetical protein
VDVSEFFSGKRGVFTMSIYSHRKVIQFFILAVLMIISSIGAIACTKQDYSMVYKDTIEQEVKDTLSKGFSQYYKINSINLRFDAVEIADDKVEAKLLVTLNTTLKTKRVEDLPYVKGMLKKVNLNNFIYESKAKTEEEVTKANRGKLNTEQIAKVSKNIDYRINDLKKYINQANEQNMYLRITANLSKNKIDKNSIEILAENVDQYVPIADFFPKSPAELEAQGTNDMQLIIDLQ